MRLIGTVWRRSAPLRLDCSVAILVFAGGWAAGTVHWNRAVAGHLPFFYQSYFEPAVMIACGKGFVISQPQVPAIGEFLAQRAPTVACDAIPAGTALGTQYLYQGAWRYLMYAVGVTWRLRGISWSQLGPLYGLLYAATLTALYATFRLGMSPALAVLGVAALATSRLHLAYFPILRDYAKAPFTLILIFLLGLLVARAPSRKNVLGAAAAYGIVLGLGYGFRTDFLAEIPILFIALFLFLPGGPAGNAGLKTAAAVLFAATFVATAWPILFSVYKSGGCQWHAAILGFSSDFSKRLGVDDPPYELSRRYLDEFAYVTVTSYAARVHPDIGHIEYCQPDYDAATGAYLRDVVRHFPADMIVRGYASVLRIIELPFTWRRAEPEDADQRASPGTASRPDRGIGLVLIAAAIIVVTAGDPRIGLFLVVFLLYFGGYPALQFDARHYFHLEFIAWWAGGFLVQCALTDLPAIFTARARPLNAAGLRRAVLLTGGCTAGLAALLWAARVYQQREAASLFQSYLAAPRVEIRLPDPEPGVLYAVGRAAPATDPETVDFLQVDVNEWACGDHPAVTFRYDKAARPFSRMFTLHRNDHVHEPTHIFMPVYDGFKAIEFSDIRPGCIGGLYRVTYQGRFAILLETVLEPEWGRRPLYQRFGPAERRPVEPLL